MSIFSSLKKSRQLAQDHKAKLAEQKKKEAAESATPYRHVPTHAAADAFASAPPSWREADRARIVAENRRRSTMTNNSYHMSAPGISRATSSLSYVAYPVDGNGNPTIHLARAYSHTGVPTLQPNGREIMYGVPQMAYSQPYSLKGKEATRWPIYETPDQAFDFGRGQCSPGPEAVESQRLTLSTCADGFSVADSSNESSSSRDNLEMRPSNPEAHAIGSAETTSSPKSRRRKSDPLTERQMGTVTARNAASGISRDPGPPPSTRGFSSIPASAAPPPLPRGQLPGHLVPVPRSSPILESPISPTSMPLKNDVATSAMNPPPSPRAANVEQVPTAANQSSAGGTSTATWDGLTSGSSAASPSLTPATPGFVSKAAVDFPFPAVAEVAPTMEDQNISPAGTGRSVAKPKDRRQARSARFTELERIESVNDGPGPEAVSKPKALDIVPVVKSEQVINVFPEATSVVTSDASSEKHRGKKLRKGGKKLLKKSRP